MESSETPLVAPQADEDELESAKRLLAIYEGLAQLSFEGCAPGEMDAIVRALEENRLRDAVDLIDVTRELDVDDSGALPIAAETPEIAAARLWRYDWQHASTGRLRAVDSRRSVALLPARTLPIKADRRWTAGIGALPTFGRATLDVGLKGELVVLLFSGEMAIADEDGEVIGRVSTANGKCAAAHFVFCREQHNPTALEFMLSVESSEPVHGIWCVSSSHTLSDDERIRDPHHKDVLFGRNLLPFGFKPTEDGAFCPDATPCTTAGYAHGELAEQGALDRYLLDSDAPAAREPGWTIDARKKSTAIITGVQSGPAADGETAVLRRALVAHGDGVELIVALRGTAWIAVTDEKQRHGEVQPGDGVDYILSQDVEAPDWLPAYVTGMVAPGTSAHDVMIINPSYHHTAWTHPGSDARFFHVFFPDPREIVLKRAGSTHIKVEQPAAKPGRAAADGNGRFRAVADPPPQGDARWTRTVASKQGAERSVVVPFRGKQPETAAPDEPPAPRPRRVGGGPW